MSIINSRYKQSPTAGESSFPPLERAVSHRLRAVSHRFFFCLSCFLSAVSHRFRVVSHRFFLCLSCFLSAVTHRLRERYRIVFVCCVRLSLSLLCPLHPLFHLCLSSLAYTRTLAKWCCVKQPSRLRICAAAARRCCRRAIAVV